MIKIKHLVFLLPIYALASEVGIEWSDISDNESGFEIRGLNSSEEWEVLGKVVKDVEEFYVDAEAHKAWQVFAFNDFGFSTGTDVLKAGSVPDGPTTLSFKKKSQISWRKKRPKNHKNHKKK